MRTKLSDRVVKLPPFLDRIQDLRDLKLEERLAFKTSLGIHNNNYFRLLIATTTSKIKTSPVGTTITKIDG